MRFAGQKTQPQRRASRFPRAATGFCALAAAIAGAAVGMIPGFLAVAWLVLSGVSYLMYLYDKAAAGKGARRTPESTLHLVDVLGGWPGALIAQQQFRHKTVKQPFQFVFWLTVCLNLAGAWWMVSSGMASELAGLA